MEATIFAQKTKNINTVFNWQYNTDCRSDISQKLKSNDEL